MDTNKVASNTMYYFLDFSVMTIAGYLLYIILGKSLDPAQYGIVLTAISLFSVISVITTFGMQESLPRLIPESRMKNESGRMIRFAIKFTSAISIMISAAILMFAGSISNVFYGSLQMTVPLQMLAIILLFGNIFFISKGILQGLQRFREMFYGDLVGNTAKIISVLILLYMGFQSMVLLVWVIWFAISSALFLYHMRDIKPDAQIFDKKKLFGYSFWSVCYLLSSMVLLQGGIILLSLMASLEAAAFFGTAFVFGQFLLFIPTVLMGSMLPVMSEQWSADMTKVKGLLAVSIKSIFLWVFPIYIVFVLMSEFLIELLYSTKYIGAASLFPAYLTGMLLFGISMMLMITLYSAGHPKRRAVTMVAGALMSIILSMIMIPFYGAEGAAMAFLIAQAFIFTLSLIFAHRKLHLRLDKKNLLWLPAILIFSAGIYSSRFFDDILIKISLCIFTCIIYVVILTKSNVLNRSDLTIFDQLLMKIKRKRY